VVGLAWSGVQGRIGAVQPLAGGVVAGVVDGGSVTDSWDTPCVEATAAGWLNSGSSGASTEHKGSSLQLSSTGGASHCNEGRRVITEHVTDRRTNHTSHRCSLSPFCFLLLSLDNNGDLQHPTGSCIREEL